MPVHTRIRPFNTRDTYPEQKLDHDLCHVVVARGANVFVRGQVGQTPTLPRTSAWAMPPASPNTPPGCMRSRSMTVSISNCP